MAPRATKPKVVSPLAGSGRPGADDRYVIRVGVGIGGRYARTMTTGAPQTSPWLRPVFVAAGVLSVVVGVAGIVLPLVPTTGPLLLAAYFFSRSSPRLHRWLVTHPRFGRFISDFQEGRGIPLRGKIVATVAMTAAFTYTIGWRLPNRWLQVLVAAVGGWALWYVHSFPTAPRRR
jgi:uncharacterized protein